MKKRSLQLLSILLVFTLLVGCGDAGNYVKDNYTLVDVQGQGKSTAKIYSVEGKDVPTVAKEVADKEKPKEISKESADQMFLVYDNKIVNVQKDPNNESNSLVEVDSIEYAKQNYDSSFLQGYIAASLIQSIFGGGWNNSRGYDYRGYTSSKRYDDYGKYQTTPKTGGSTVTPPTTTTKPTPATTDRKGSFNSAPTTKSPSVTTPPKSSSSNNSSNTRKNDGSTSTYKSPSSSKSGSSSKPSTSTRSGSFKKK
ncbi:DUF4247 domain-containing protein [Paenibacillus sp. LMG 31456]|uniref:DUF4247 domain-containing protein n=1 Tax=Paenibacillus foliorum TaxID=2654974 RepID=A0A972GWJ6_9BACL|nr:DUF4247 domain-containing protein [Paenibacillus foliorum]NOU97947.1 DUF4247 domain-containing protein [Paenibacillus foliorum]